MAGAGFWAFLGASSLIIGALIAMSGRLSTWALALLIGFGSGALISAVAYDLIEEAVQVSATGLSVAVGFVAGAVVYFIGDQLIQRMPGSGGLEILLGAVLDGIPESIVLGLSLVGGAGPSVAVLVAIFISNVPESVASSTAMLKGGRKPPWVFGVWTLVVIASALSAALGYALFAGASGDVISFIDAFAAGAILTLLASELLPSAHAEKNRFVGLATAAGFAVAAMLTLKRMTSARELAERLGMQAHPEGGWYVETWQAPARDDARPAASAILFLLGTGERSHWHRLDTDEVWQWSAGDDLELRIWTEGDESIAIHRLGGEVGGTDESVVQAIVPKGAWQTARTLGAWTLVGCIVAPAFRFDGFELAPPDWEPPIG